MTAMHARQIPFSFALQDNYAAEDFLVSDANEAAYQWVQSWPQGWPGQGLVLVGPAGSGKTHLLHLWKDMAQASRLTESALHASDLDALVQKQPYWVVDDLEHWLRDTASQKLLFHWFNMVTARQGSMLLAAREPIARMDGVLADIHSRLSMLPSVTIGQPDEALLRAVLVKLLHDRQLQATKAVVDYIMTHGERSFTGIQQLLMKLDALSLAEKRAITIPLVKQVMDG